MSAQANYFRLGVFVLAGCVMAIGGVVAFGAGSLWEDPLLAETYINESVQGLAVGSPVKYRGVQIGKVAKISFVAIDYAPKTSAEVARKYGQWVVVRMALDLEAFQSVNPTPIERIIEERVQQGLRVRLSSQGLTGVAYIEADYLPPETEIFKPEWTPESYYVPSAPSTLTKLTESAEGVFRDLNDAEIGEVAKDIRVLAREVTRAITEDVTPLLQNVNKLANDLGPTLKNLDAASAELPAAVKNVKDITEDLKPAAKDVAAAVAPLPETVEKVGDIAAKLDQTLANISRDLDDLGSKLERVAGKLEVAIDEDLGPTLKNLHGVSNDLPGTLALIDRTVKRVDHLIAGEEEDIGRLVASLSSVAKDLEALSALIKKYPSGVLFGDPPPHREAK
jgi:ABC-type transporter Mla subunit MlaD